MKKLLLITILGLCACTMAPDHKAVVVLNHLKYPSDTITINYRTLLKLTTEGNLVDDNDSKFGECKSFSILEEWSITDQVKMRDTTVELKTNEN